MPKKSRKLPERLYRELKRADAIIHAGDWTTMSVYETLAGFAPTDGVAGNNDETDIVKTFGYRKVLTLEGCRIGVVHGNGPGKRSDTEQRALDTFKGSLLDAVIFGHTHSPVRKYAGGLLVFNPGSPTDKRKQACYSFGIFRLNSGLLRAEHVFFKNCD
jgi:putative phosphoesterase